MERSELSKLICNTISQREHTTIFESTTIADIGCDNMRLRTYWVAIKKALNQEGILLNGNPGDFEKLKSLKEIIDLVEKKAKTKGNVCT